MDIPPHERQTTGVHGASIRGRDTPERSLNFEPWFAFIDTNSDPRIGPSIADEASAFLVRTMIDAKSLGPLFASDTDRNPRLEGGRPSPDTFWA